MNMFSRTLQRGYQAMFGTIQHEPHPRTYPVTLPPTTTSSVRSQKRKAEHEPIYDCRERKRARSHSDAPAAWGTRRDIAPVELGDHSIIPESLSKPMNASKDQVTIVPVDHQGLPMKAILLDGTLRTLLRTAVDAERNNTLQVMRADVERAHLAHFRRYAEDTRHYLTKGQEILGKRSDRGSEIAKLQVAHSDIGAKIEGVAIEEKNIRSRLEWAAWRARKRQAQVLYPLESALVQEGIVGDEKALSDSASAQEFKEYFAVPPPKERYLPPGYMSVTTGGSLKPPSIFDRDLSISAEDMYQQRLGTKRHPAGSPREELFPPHRGVGNGIPALGQAPDPRAAALEELHLRRIERDQARTSFERRRRETGADHFLCQKARNQVPQFESPLEFDLHQFKGNNALTRALIEAENRLVEAEGAARNLDIDISTPSQTFGFNDPDGDVDSEARQRLSGVHHTAIGVRTSHIVEWMESLPPVVTHDVPVKEIQPEKRELDDWEAVPLGNYDSFSVMAEGRPKERIEREQKAGKAKRKAAAEEWGRRYPRRKGGFDRWHINKRGGCL